MVGHSLDDPEFMPGKAHILETRESVSIASDFAGGCGCGKG